MTLLGSRETHTSLLCDISLHFLTYAFPKYKMSAWCHLPAVIYLFKVNNWNNSTMREISSNLMIKTQESQYFQESKYFRWNKSFQIEISHDLLWPSKVSVLNFLAYWYNQLFNTSLVCKLDWVFDLWTKCPCWLKIQLIFQN